MMIVRLFNELFYFILSLFIVQSENMSSICFQTRDFSSLWLIKDFGVYLIHEYIRKGDCHFRAHGCTCV